MEHHPVSSTDVPSPKWRTCTASLGQRIVTLRYCPRPWRYSDTGESMSTINVHSDLWEVEKCKEAQG